MLLLRLNLFFIPLKSHTVHVATKSKNHIWIRNMCESALASKDGQTDKKASFSENGKI